jgi:hypothetical protein
MLGLRRTCFLAAAVLGLLRSKTALAQEVGIFDEYPGVRLPGPAAADEPADATPAEPVERTPVGLTVDFGVGSAYGYRGLNLVAESSQHDQRLVMQPSLAYEVPETGLTLTYFSSYQVTGERQAQVDAGMSDEQDLTVAFEREVTEGVSIGALFNAFVYPMAREQAAGTDVPVYLEPGLSATWSTVVDLSLSTSFLFGVQDALRSYRYVYVNPKVGKTLEITPAVSLTGSLGYGVKAQQTTDNRHDLLVDVGVTFLPSELFYVTPAVHWAWTNLEGATFVDEQFAWVSTNVGSSF